MVHYMNDDSLQSCKFNKDGLHGNLLAMVGGEGFVKLYDTRKRLSESEISRTFLPSIVPCNNSLILLLTFSVFFLQISKLVVKIYLILSGYLKALN